MKINYQDIKLKEFDKYFKLIVNGVETLFKLKLPPLIIRTKKNKLEYAPIYYMKNNLIILPTNDKKYLPTIINSFSHELVHHALFTQGTKIKNGVIYKWNEILATAFAIFSVYKFEIIDFYKFLCSSKAKEKSLYKKWYKQIIQVKDSFFNNDYCKYYSKALKEIN